MFEVDLEYATANNCEGLEFSLSLKLASDLFLQILQVNRCGTVAPSTSVTEMGLKERF